MAWMDVLKNGNELSELLIEGGNPYGASLLKHSDVDLMRNHLRPGERVLAYVLGRVVFLGRGFWLLSDQQLLISEDDKRSAVHAIELKDITSAQCVKGKYGYTLRVTAAGQTRSVYGAAAHMAAVFYQALGRQTVCSPIEKPTALQAQDVAEVVHRFTDAAIRLQPGVAADADVQLLIAQLAHDVAAIDGGQAALATH